LFQFLHDIFYLLLKSKQKNFITINLTACLSFGSIDELYIKNYT